eukprot:6442934-Pyramimonas_sp.AAC.2
MVFSKDELLLCAIWKLCTSRHWSVSLSAISAASICWRSLVRLAIGEPVSDTSPTVDSSVEITLLTGAFNLQGGGQEGIYRSSLDAREPRNRDGQVKNTGGIFKVCCTVHEGHQRPKRGCYRRCEHPGFPGAKLRVHVLVPWTNPSQEGIYRSSLDA